MVYACPSPNRSVCASPPYGGSGYEKPQPAQAPLCGFYPPHFFAPVKMLRIFPYQEGNLRPTGSVEDRAQKNVSYSQNVKRKFFE
jgi:hypothetical protein